MSEQDTSLRTHLNTKDNVKRTLNPEHFKQVCELVNASPYVSLLGITFTEMGHGIARAEMDVAKRHMNPYGNIHGGVLASVCDSVGGYSCYGDLPEGMGFTTMDLQVNDLHSMEEGHIFAVGRVIKMGHTTALAEVTITDDRDKLICYATTKLFLSDRIQTIEDAVKATGWKPLPPKYLD